MQNHFKSKCVKMVAVYKSKGKGRGKKKVFYRQTTFYWAHRPGTKEEWG